MTTHGRQWKLSARSVEGNGRSMEGYLDDGHLRAHGRCQGARAHLPTSKRPQGLSGARKLGMCHQRSSEVVTGRQGPSGGLLARTEWRKAGERKLPRIQNLSGFEARSTAERIMMRRKRSYLLAGCHERSLEVMGSRGRTWDVVGGYWSSLEAMGARWRSREVTRTDGPRRERRRGRCRRRRPWRRPWRRRRSARRGW